MRLKMVRIIRTPQEIEALASTTEIYSQGIFRTSNKRKILLTFPHYLQTINVAKEVLSIEEDPGDEIQTLILLDVTFQK